MGTGLSRYALWAVVAMLVVTIFASIGSVQATAPNYTLSGYVEQPGGLTMPKAGVTVDLINSATHQTLTASTTAGGAFSFTTASTSGGLVPGWWGLWVPPQTNLSLGGGLRWAALPAGSSPTFYDLNASVLTGGNEQLVTNATLLQLSSTVSGTVTFGGSGPAAGATVDLYSSAYPGFAINATTTNATGYYSFHVPSGTWILSTSSTGSSVQYNTTQLVVPPGANRITVNPSIQSYIAYGNIYNSVTGKRIFAGGNVTLFDTSTGTILTEPILPGSYSIGTYPAGFTGPGSSSFLVFVSPQGYSTVGYPLTVGPGNPSNARDVSVTPLAPPAQYNTTLAFTPGFTNVTVTSTAILHNDSVFATLPNATVGQLWTQLGLDFNGGSTTFPGAPSAPASAFTSWVASQGPFFAPGENALNVNGTTYNQTAPYAYTGPVVPAGPLTYTSGGSLYANWSAKYNATGSVTGGGSGNLYTIAFGFRYPTGPESVNYTVDLPAGFALAANTAKPTNSVLYPAGQGGTWTNFTLSAKPVAPGASTYGSANFTVVRYGAITAIVNITTSYFAYSAKNVISSARSNYTAVVGTGQTVTFSAQNSTYPDRTNGSVFHWDFGGNNLKTTTTPTTTFTYTTPGEYKGYVSILSSGGRTSQANFTVWVGNAAPTAKITSNATANETHTAGSVTYLEVNWSQSLQFNITGSNSTLAGNISKPSGVLSVALWSAASGKFNQTSNYSASSGAKVNSNFTVNFHGAGPYIRNASIGGQPAIALNGWWYNVTLRLWDGQGHAAKVTLPVLVKDSQPPTPVITLRNSAGTNVTSLVEGTNHTAQVQFDSQYSYDPNNGSAVRFVWNVTNPANASFHLTKDWGSNTYWTGYLAPMAKPYHVNLTVYDLAGNHALAQTNLTVAANTTTTPILAVSNLTAPSTMDDGTSYTIWGNVTNTVGKLSTAQNVVVRFYILKPGQSGSGTTIASGSAVKFYNYTSAGVVASSPTAVGTLPKLPYNQTVRVEISWTPGVTGSYNLYMNATCANEIGVALTANVASVPVTLNPNPNQQLYTDIEIGAVAAAVIVLLIFYFGYWRPRHPAGSTTRTTTTTRSGLERGGRKSTTTTTTEETDEDET